MSRPSLRQASGEGAPLSLEEDMRRGVKAGSAVSALALAGVILAGAAGFVPAQQKQTDVVVYKDPG